MMDAYTRQTDRPVDAVFERLQDACKAHGFGVLHSYDFKQILADKGVPIAAECRVLEVCNPQQAHDVLQLDIAVNMALPCRLSVYEADGRTVVAMIPPKALLALASDDARIAPAAAEVERSMEQIIDQAL